jgi:transcriptional regulator with XRE-family HTH domain
MNELHKIIGHRIRQARAESKLTPDEVVARINAMSGAKISMSAYYNWELEVRAPKTENLMRLAVVLGKTPAWLNGYTNDEDGTGAKTNYVTANSPIITTDAGTIAVPQSCANSAYHIPYLERRGLDSSKLLAIHQLDSSMSPLIEEKAEVLLDCTRTKPEGVDLFGIVVADKIWIRRIRQETDGSFTLLAQNQSEYPDQHLSREEMDKVQVVGRVVRIATDR